MSSAFLGLNISLSGLFANQRALGVTAHNIANVNTEGYTRQRMTMTQYRPDNLTGGLGTLGVGVDVTAVQQIRDEYIDYKLRAETSELGEWEARADVLSQIEDIFNEPSDTSISQILEDFYEAVQELSNNPENLTARTLVRESGIAFTEGINRISTSLKDLQEDMNIEFKSSVDLINQYAEEIVTFNKTIYQYELDGGTANDVRDQRNLVLDKLSELVDIEYYEDDQNRFHVSISGHELVSHYRADELVLEQRTEKVNEDDADRLYDVKWADGNKFTTSSGKVKGLLDIRDSMEGDTKGIPYYLDKLNEFVDTFSAEVNRIHQAGYGLDESTGVAFFTIDGMTTEEFEEYLLEEGLDGGAAVDVTSAILNGTSDSNTFDENTEIINDNINTLLESNPSYSNKSVRLVGDKYYIVDKLKSSQITISADIDDLNKIATASDSEELPGDGTNMGNIFNTRHNTKLYDWGAPEDFVKSLISNLGVDAGQADNVVTNQELLTNQLIIQKESVSGVSLDEEMTEMIKFQNAYNANARMVNVFDEMLDLVVNRLGTVGR
jgi:flagellar hook-associated protein 1 FlgK